MTVSAFTFDLGMVSARAVDVQVVFLVDEQYPMYFFRQLLTPYVQHTIGDWSQQVVAALRDYGSIAQPGVGVRRAAAGGDHGAGG